MGKINTSKIEMDPGEIRNEHISDSTDIDADKLEHLYRPGTNFDLAVGGTPVTREETVFVAATAGIVRGFHAMLTDSGTSTNIDFDLKKNGTTMLSAAINIVHGDGDGTVKDGTLSVTTFVADDRITIAMTVTSATGAQGPWAWAEIQETAAVS